MAPTLILLYRIISYYFGVVLYWIPLYGFNNRIRYNYPLHTSITMFMLLFVSSVTLPIDAHNVSSYWNCTARDVCRETTLQCNATGDCTALCTHAYSCYESVLNGPINGNFNVKCGDAIAHVDIGWDACQDTIINCPIYGLCDISVDLVGYPALTVNAASMVSGSLSLKISVKPPATNINVYCPGNNLNCSIEGIASLWRGSHSGQVPYSYCQDINIYVPNGTSMHLSIVGPKNPVINTRIYAVNGLKDVSVSCINASSITECYDESKPIQMACNQNYGAMCNLYPVGGNATDWQCDSVNSTALCLTNVSDGYYGTHLVCNDAQECSFGLYCVDDKDCTIECSGEQSCRYGTFYPQNVGNLTVICGRGHRACYGKTITAPKNGSFKLFCDYSGSCENVHGICPIFGVCIASILSEHATHPITLDASNMISGSVSVTSVRNSTIKCPGNHLQCFANCTAYPCASTSFHTQNGSILNVLASGSTSLASVDVYCVANANCSVSVTEPVSDALSDFRLFSVTGIDGIYVSLICNYTTNSNECYDAARAPQLHCNGFNKTCDLELQDNSMSDWDCIGISFYDRCDLLTNQPTFAPVYPSRSPTTESPTKSPTTESPTKSPTTESPTKSPTPGACPLYYDLDIAFLVDDSCGLSATQCREQQVALAELVVSFKRYNNPRFMYVTFSDSYDVLMDLDNKMHNDLLPGGESKAERNHFDLYYLIRDYTCDLTASSVTHLNDAINFTLESFQTNDPANERNFKMVIISRCKSTDTINPCSFAPNDKLRFNGRRSTEEIEAIVINVDMDDAEYLKCLTVNDRHHHVSDINTVLQQVQTQVCNQPTLSPTFDDDDADTKYLISFMSQIVIGVVLCVIVTMVTVFACVYFKHAKLQAIVAEHHGNIVHVTANKQASIDCFDLIPEPGMREDSDSGNSESMYVEEHNEGIQLAADIVEIVEEEPSDQKEKETSGDAYYDEYLKRVYDEKNVVHPRDAQTIKGVEVNYHEDVVSDIERKVPNTAREGSTSQSSQVAACIVKGDDVHETNLL
eukprot:883900_1